MKTQHSDVNGVRFGGAQQNGVALTRRGLVRGTAAAVAAGVAKASGLDALMSPAYAAAGAVASPASAQAQSPHFTYEPIPFADIKQSPDREYKRGKYSFAMDFKTGLMPNSLRSLSGANGPMEILGIGLVRPTSLADFQYITSATYNWCGSPELPGEWRAEKATGRSYRFIPIRSFKELQQVKVSLTVDFVRSNLKPEVMEALAGKTGRIQNAASTTGTMKSDPLYDIFSNNQEVQQALNENNLILDNDTQMRRFLTLVSSVDRLTKKNYITNYTPADTLKNGGGVCSDLSNLLGTSCLLSGIPSWYCSGHSIARGGGVGGHGGNLSFVETGNGLEPVFMDMTIESSRFDAIAISRATNQDLFFSRSFGGEWVFEVDGNEVHSSFMGPIVVFYKDSSGRLGANGALPPISELSRIR